MPSLTEKFVRLKKCTVVKDCEHTMRLTGALDRRKTEGQRRLDFVPTFQTHLVQSFLFNLIRDIVEEVP